MRVLVRGLDDVRDVLLVGETHPNLFASGFRLVRFSVHEDACDAVVHHAVASQAVDSERVVDLDGEGIEGRWEGNESGGGVTEPYSEKIVNRVSNHHTQHL